jgi:hypothetical protein
MYANPIKEVPMSKMLNTLEVFFPMDHCRELTKLALEAMDAKQLAEDPVIFPVHVPEDLKYLDKDPQLSDDIVISSVYSEASTDC